MIEGDLLNAVIQNVQREERGRSFLKVHLSGYRRRTKPAQHRQIDPDHDGHRHGNITSSALHQKQIEKQ